MRRSITKLCATLNVTNKTSLSLSLADTTDFHTRAHILDLHESTNTPKWYYPSAHMSFPSLLLAAIELSSRTYAGWHSINALSESVKTWAKRVLTSSTSLAHTIRATVIYNYFYLYGGCNVERRRSFRRCHWRSRLTDRHSISDLRFICEHETSLRTTYAKKSPPSAMDSGYTIL